MTSPGQLHFADPAEEGQEQCVAEAKAGWGAPKLQDISGVKERGVDQSPLSLALAENWPLCSSSHFSSE